MSTNIIDSKFTTFQPQGYVSAANANDFLQELIEVVKTEKSAPLLIDMKEVDFMDSAGLMALIEGFRLAEEMKRDLSICSVTPSVRMIFELTQLDHVFNIFENQASYLAKVRHKGV